MNNGLNSNGIDQPKRSSNHLSLDERYPPNTLRPKAGTNRPYCIDFVRKSGKREAFPYSNLVWIVCAETKKRVEFHFSSHTAVVTGYRLQSLYERALNQELDRVEEVNEVHESDAEEGPVVTEIHTPRVEDTRTESDQDFAIDPEVEGD